MSASVARLLRTGALWLGAQLLTSASCSVAEFDPEDKVCADDASCGPGWICADGRCARGASVGTSSTGQASTGSGVGGGCACSEPPPEGWEGPFYLFDGELDSPCPGDMAGEVYVSGVPGDVTCAACECVVTDARCYAGTLLCGSSCSQNTTVPETCTSPPPFNDFPSCKLTNPPKPGTGSCAASVVTPVVVASPDWQARRTRCPAGALGGCGAGRACLDPNLGALVCIAKEGTDSEQCPAAWNEVRVPAYTGGDDNRGCGDCACPGPPSGIACGLGEYWLFKNDACTGGPPENAYVIDSAAGCTQYSAVSAAIAKPDAPDLSVATCPPPVGGAPKGAVDPQGPVTFCCLELP
jgi:hypothetical protein